MTKVAIQPEEIIALREGLSLSQEKFADRLGVSFTTVHRWESGKSSPQHAALGELIRMRDRSGQPQMASMPTKVGRAKSSDDSHALVNGGIKLAFVGSRIPAGFPSPAEDFDVERLSLIDALTPHPLTTFLWRVSGMSMVDAGIFDGDIIVVDRSLQASHGDVVVAQVDNDFTVKYLHKRDVVKLVPANPQFPEIVFREGQMATIVGVVTSTIKQFRKLA